MNILKLLSANETAMVTAGQIYWSINEHGSRRYFVPGSKHGAYATREGACSYADKNRLDSNDFHFCATIEDARNNATAVYRQILHRRGQTSLLNFMKVVHR